MTTGTSANTSPEIDAALARRLVDAQFPQWAGLPLRLLDPAGSDHVIYRLGEELSVRLPRRAGSAGEARKESTWLPRLAPRLLLAVPVPVGVGEPQFGYPWPWAVTRWLPGEVPTAEALGDSTEAAVELAAFLVSLQGCPLDGVTSSGGGASLTVRSLADRDLDTRAAIAEVGDRFGTSGISGISGTFDTAAMTRLWDAALSAPGWDRPPVWFHGDFHNGNLLTMDGRLSAVIDFGGLGVGDPSCDLMIAFTLMSTECRALFREVLDVDDATWVRGRGWALATGLSAFTAYAAINPQIAAQTTRQIRAALVG